MDSANSAELTVLAMAMVDNSFAALTLGDAERATTLANDSLLNEHVKAVTVLGTQVNLDDISTGFATGTNEAILRDFGSGITGIAMN